MGDVKIRREIPPAVCKAEGCAINAMCRVQRRTEDERVALFLAITAASATGNFDWCVCTASENEQKGAFKLIAAAARWS